MSVSEVELVVEGGSENQKVAVARPGSLLEPAERLTRQDPCANPRSAQIGYMIGEVIAPRRVQHPTEMTYPAEGSRRCGTQCLNLKHR